MDIAELIDFPDSKVISVTKNDRHHLIITIETTEFSVACRTYRYICEDCDHHTTTTATACWHQRDSSYTIDYENHVLMELVNSTIVDVAIKESLTESSVMGVMDRHIESTVNWNSINTIDVLGIDEIALKKGYKDYITLITSRHEGNIRLLAILKGKKKTVIRAFFKSMPLRCRKTVTAICVDLYDRYINAIKSIFKKKTIIVVDRYHVAMKRWLNKVSYSASTNSSRH